MRSNERRADLFVTVVLLVLSVIYLVRMVTYPEAAGKVPAIVAAVMIGTLVVQLVLGRRTVGAHPARRGSDEPASLLTDDEPSDRAYDELIALHGPRLRRFLLISVWTISYFVLVVLVGFVVAAPIAVGGILALSKERMAVVVVGAALALAAAYGLLSMIGGVSLFSGVLLS